MHLEEFDNSFVTSSVFSQQSGEKMYREWSLSSKLKTFRYDFFQKSTQSDEMNQNAQRFKYNKGCIKMMQPFFNSN